MLIATGACRHADFAVVFYTALYGLWGTFAHVVIYGGQGRWPYFFMDINHLGLWCIMWYCVLLVTPHTLFGGLASNARPMGVG
jgi:hypothetical protein